MGIYEHAEQLAGLPVHDFHPDDGVADPARRAYRITIDYDGSEGGETFVTRLDQLLADPASRQVRALVVGTWEGSFDSGNNSTVVVEALARRAASLPALEALFLGDITGDECEISWIQQSDATPLLDAFPGLRHLQVRGGNGLELRSGTSHAGLRTLIIESGGLPAQVVRSVAALDAPNLEHLELWLGEENYGGDATAEDLEPILSGRAFPKLTYLGLRDSDQADAIAAALADAPILRRIEVLDLSLGTLGDDGALALLRGGGLAGLHKLDIEHHFVRPEVLDGLKALGIEINDDDAQDPDDEYRYCAVSE